MGIATLLVATSIVSARAQTPHDAPVLAVSGIVALGADPAPRPLAGVWVTLHRVGADRSGALDSVRTTAQGRYTFRYRATGDTSALYFVSSRHAGIAYFTAPLPRSAANDGAGDLLVFDTTSGPVPIHVRGRHLVVMAPVRGNGRTVVEAFELSNDSSLTRVARDSQPVFEALLPDNATEVHAREGDLAPESVVFVDGRLQVFAPIAPGLKQFSVTYRLPAATAAIVVPGMATVTALEVMTEGDAMSATGAGLIETKPTTLNGRRFRRFLAQEVPANSVFTVAASITPGGISPRTAFMVLGIGAVMLLALARSFGSQASRARHRNRDDDPDALDRALRSLDAAYANLAEPTPDQRADHYEARAHLATRRSAALARRDARP